MKPLRLCLMGCLLLVSSQAAASQMIMVRVSQSFPEAMLGLQASIAKQGYTVSRVQRIDIGLTNSGFKTDKYRVVFFGKADEVAELTEKYPELIPYLPWKVVIFAEQDETLMVAHDPEGFASFFPDKELVRTFKVWRKDLVEMLERVRDTSE